MKYKLRNNYPTDPGIALEAILQDRGVEDIKNFMNPSVECELNPYNLENIEDGAEMLLKHLSNDNNILFVVDQDADGFTSSSILWLYIKENWPSAKLFFMIHERKQHGLRDLIDKIEANPIYELVVIPDASSYDVEEHERLNNLGIDCLVLDHHSQLYDNDGNPIVSKASHTIVINNQLSPNYLNKSLCGAGVVYKFCEVLDNILGLSEPLAQNFLDLAALGEIADVMDKTNTETNYIMEAGLCNIKNKGLKTLLAAQSFTLKEKALPPYPGLTTIDIAFYIAPLINAVTRVGTMDEKECMFYAFTQPDLPLQSTKRGAKQGDIELAADQFARASKNIKSRQERLKEKAIEAVDFQIQKEGLAENNIILVDLEEPEQVPQELTGLVAMAMVNKYGKPCMIGRASSQDLVQGSIRSNGNFAGLPSFKKFMEDSNFIEYAAGHDNAAGFGIYGNKIDQFIQYANTNLRAQDFEQCYIVDYVLDATDSNTYSLIQTLSSHPEYFGNHIDEVKFVIKNIPLGQILLMGADKSSVRVSANGVDYVRFKDPDFADKILQEKGSTLTVYGRGNINFWGGKASVQVFVDDYEFDKDDHRFDF